MSPWSSSKPSEYALISVIPYTLSVNPGNLAILACTAQHEATRLCLEHKELANLFYETIGVEKALLKQLVAAIEPKFIEDIRDEKSYAVEHNLHDVLDHLFLSRYGDVNGDKCNNVNIKVKWMSYHPSDLIVIVFTSIEELTCLGTATQNPYSDK